MIAITLFYILFLVLLILLIFIILLYSGYHTRTLAPPLLDTFYGINSARGGNIPATMSTLYLTDGADTNFSAGVSGSLDFGASGSTHQEFAFRPMWDDSQRKLKGNITLLINKGTSTTPGLELQLIDEGDSNTVVAETTGFDIKEYTKGLGEIKLYFTSRSLSGNNYHKFVLRGKSSSGTSIPTSQILLNSAYMYYY